MRQYGHSKRRHSGGTGGDKGVITHAHATDAESTVLVGTGLFHHGAVTNEGHGCRSQRNAKMDVAINQIGGKPSQSTADRAVGVASRNPAIATGLPRESSTSFAGRSDRFLGTDQMGSARAADRVVDPAFGLQRLATKRQEKVL